MALQRLTPLDRLLGALNDFIGAQPAKHSVRPYPAENVAECEFERRDKLHAAALMRVNHAGEVAAQGLYRGHAAVARDVTLAKQMQQAANEEMDHLAWCEQRLDALADQPSRLRAAWYGGAVMMGALSGLCGDRWSLGFIAETERQVCEHLDNHMERLPASDLKSRAIVNQMRIEEAVHGAMATEAGGAELPEWLQGLMHVTSKLMTRCAYWI